MAIDGKIRIDSAEVTAAIRRTLMVLPLGGDATPMFSLIGRIVKSDTQLRFREGTAPDGTPWKPSERVIEHGGQTLRLTGRLRNSITFLADHASVEIGTNVVYGPRHQFGFEGDGKGRGHSTTPKREFLGASEAARKEIVEAVNGFLGKTWTG